MRLRNCLFLILLSVLLLAGCADRQLPEQGQSSSSPSQSSSDPAVPAVSPPESTEKDNEWYNQTYITPLSLYRLEDFASPTDNPPESWLYYYLLANYDGPGKLPIPEGYRNQDNYQLLIPGEEAEDFLLAHFELTADYLRTAENYVKAKQSYSYEFLGMNTSSHAEVTNVQQQGDTLSIIFDVYLDLGNPETEESTQPLGPVATRITTITPSQDGFRVEAMETLFQADLDELLGSSAAE